MDAASEQAMLTKESVKTYRLTLGQLYRDHTFSEWGDEARATHANNIRESIVNLQALLACVETGKKLHNLGGDDPRHELLSRRMQAEKGATYTSGQQLLLDALGLMDEDGAGWPHDHAGQRLTGEAEELFQALLRGAAATKQDQAVLPSEACMGLSIPPGSTFAYASAQVYENLNEDEGEDDD